MNELKKGIKYKIEKRNYEVKLKQYGMSHHFEKYRQSFSPSRNWVVADSDTGQPAKTTTSLLVIIDKY